MSCRNSGSLIALRGRKYERLSNCLGQTPCEKRHVAQGVGMFLGRVLPARLLWRCSQTLPSVTQGAQQVSSDKAAFGPDVGIPLREGQYSVLTNPNGLCWKTIPCLRSDGSLLCGAAVFPRAPLLSLLLLCHVPVPDARMIKFCPVK